MMADFRPRSCGGLGVVLKPGVVGVGLLLLLAGALLAPAPYAVHRSCAAMVQGRERTKKM